MFSTAPGDSYRRMARRALDRRLRGIPADAFARPAGGWVRAVREALGMSATELGQRMGITRRRVAAIETEELIGAMKLATLQRAAEAMDCRLVYAFVPKAPLEELVQARAREKAEGIVRNVSHHMRLEEQGVGAEGERREVDRLAERLADQRGLWSD